MDNAEVKILWWSLIIVRNPSTRLYSVNEERPFSIRVYPNVVSDVLQEHELPHTVRKLLKETENSLTLCSPLSLAHLLAIGSNSLSWKISETTVWWILRLIFPLLVPADNARQFWYFSKLAIIQTNEMFLYYRRNHRPSIYRSFIYSLLQWKTENLTRCSGIETRRSIFVETYETVISLKTLHRGSNYTKIITRLFAF
jgi:hypothetical protein